MLELDSIARRYSQAPADLLGLRPGGPLALNINRVCWGMGREEDARIARQAKPMGVLDVGGW